MHFNCYKNFKDKITIKELMIDFVIYIDENYSSSSLIERIRILEGFVKKLLRERIIALRENTYDLRRSDNNDTK